MKGVISKIDPLKLSRNGDTHFMRIYFQLETGQWAKCDLCPSYRNFSRWKPLLKVGVTLQDLSLKAKNEVNADCWPKPYETPVLGEWVQNPDGSMKFVKAIEPEVKTFSVKSETDKNKNYNVAFLESGFVCDCPAFQYRGICKHVSRMAQVNQPSLI